MVPVQGRQGTLIESIAHGDFDKSYSSCCTGKNNKAYGRKEIVKFTELKVAA
jgi:hypothetical protein